MARSVSDIGPETFSLEGRVAVVTGGASGIGRATCLALAATGAAVVVADLNEAGARQVAGEIEARKGRAFAQQVDLAQEDAIVAMIEAAVRQFGGLDILHNNAADSDPALMAADGAIVELTTEVWDRNMRINLRAPMLGCKHAIPHMIRRGGGAIVITSSVGAVLGNPGSVAYAASKHALTGVMKVAAVELAPHKIRVNTVNPGLVDTPMIRTVEQELAPGDPAKGRTTLQDATLLKRYVDPVEVAGLMLFLVSEAGSFCTGGMYMIDGGMQYCLQH